MRLYVNGEFDGWTTVTGVFNATGPLLLLSGDKWGGAPHSNWPGHVDDVQILTGALDMAEIRRHM